MSLEFLLNFPTPSGSPAPVAIKQEPETIAPAAANPACQERRDRRQREDAANKTETAPIKPEAAVSQSPTATCDFCPFTYQDWRQLWAH
jgi:hypothetical protein